MSNKWVSVKVLAAPFFLESLSGPIFATGAQGIQEQENDFIVYYDWRDWNQDVYWLLLRLCSEVIPDFDETRLAVETHDEQNWLEKWKQSFKPFKIGQRIVVAPDWDEYAPRPGEILLKIAPKMAFGTGHHESTRLCLQLLEKYFRPETRLLDAGTGSGILSIFTARLGGRHILGIDNDAVAIDNAWENARLNQVEDRLRFEVRDVARLPRGRFDGIVANINRNVLLQIAAGLVSALSEGGWLILSGLLRSDRQMVEDAYLKNGLQLLEAVTLNEWLALVFKKEAADDN
ncbi:50S ribosomal protein L11 methyltransferase [Calditrichota bacterium LG25]